MAFPQLLPAKWSPTLTAEEDHQLSLYVLAWLADHMALPHLRTLLKTKGQLPQISLENKRDLLMSPVLVMYTTNDFDRIHGSPLVSWLPAPTYALMVPEIARPLHSAPIDLLSQCRHSLIKRMETMGSLSIQSHLVSCLRWQEEVLCHRLNWTACTAKIKNMLVRFKSTVNKWTPCPEKHRSGETNHMSFRNQKLTILLSILQPVYHS